MHASTAHLGKVQEADPTLIKWRQSPSERSVHLNYSIKKDFCIVVFKSRRIVFCSSYYEEAYAGKSWLRLIKQRQEYSNLALQSLMLVCLALAAKFVWHYAHINNRPQHIIFTTIVLQSYAAHRHHHSKSSSLVVVLASSDSSESICLILRIRSSLLHRPHHRSLSSIVSQSLPHPH